MRRRMHGTLPAQPPAHYEPYLDGLFTYCLSVLCEHDAAAGALGDVLAMAERQRARLHDPELRRPWLYALARWACLHRLSQDGRPVPAKASSDVAAQRRRELSALAWPEAAGTTPEQREALELAVRHQLAPNEVAHVVGIEPDAARALLAQAACEVERTRAALAVVELGRCPAVARLAGDTQVLLGTALRRELVRHVDECPDCRFTAERAVATGPWPGLAATTAATAVLAVIEAPRPAAYAALLDSMRAGAGRTREGTPRFDRRGFPLAVRDRAVRRARLRNRAVTSTVIAAVVAAPVLALWAATYHGASLAPDEKADDGSFSAPEGGGLDGLDGHLYEKAGVADSARPGLMPRVRVSVASASQLGSPAASLSATPSRTASSGPDRSVPGPGRLTVAAEPRGDVTVITLTADGGSDVRWSASTGASWLRLSRDSGVLRPGDSTTITVAVDHASEPAGPWTARITFAPSGAVVTLQGTGRPADSPSADPTPSATDPSPTGSDPSEPSDAGTPSD